MNFISDKDLRKAPPKKTTSLHSRTASKAISVESNHTQISAISTPNVVTGTSQTYGSTPSRPAIAVSPGESSSSHANLDIVERTKIEREQRNLLRAQATSVLLLQRWWRGRRVAKQYFSLCLQDFDKKLQDTAKVASVLSSRGVSFVPPENICINLTRVLLYADRNYFADSIKNRGSAEMISRLIKLLDILLLPALRSKVAQSTASTTQKSGIDFLNLFLKSEKFLLLKLIYCILSAVQSGPDSSKYATPISTVQITQPLAGSSKKSQSKASERTKIAMSGKDKHTLLIFVNLCCFASEEFRIETEPAIYGDLRRCLESSGIRLFDFMRNSLIQSSEALLQRSQVSQDKLTVEETSNPADIMLNILLKSLRYDGNEQGKRELLLQILSIPVLTLMISTTMKIQLAINPFLSDLLTGFVKQETKKLNPNHCLQVDDVCTSAIGIQGGHWYLGNISSLGLIILERQSQYIGAYLCLCQALLVKYPLPNLLIGRVATIWTKAGSTMTAANLPISLQTQIIADGLLNNQFMRKLTQRYIIPLSHYKSSIHDDIDIEEVSSALKKGVAAIDIAQEAVKSDQQGVSKYISSKWAQKVVTGLSFSSFTSTSKRQSIDHKASTSTPKEDISEMTVIHMTTVLPLIRIWSIILPMSALSTPDMLPWKAISSLSFMDGAIDGFLGTAMYSLSLLNLSLDQYNKVFDAKNDIHLPSSNLSDKAHIKDIHASLCCLFAILKIALVGTDDDDLYDRNAPIPLHTCLKLIRCGKTLLAKIIKQYPFIAVDPSAEKLSERNFIQEDDKKRVKGVDNNEKSFMASFFSSMFGWSSNDSIQNDLQSKSGTLEPQSVVVLATAGNSFDMDSLSLFSCCRCVSSILTDLHTRWSRHPFSKDHSLWEIDEVSSILRDINSPDSTGILKLMAWCIPFVKRLKLVRNSLDSDRIRIQGNGSTDILSQTRSKGTIVKIRRSQILSDGMTAFALLKSVDSRQMLSDNESYQGTIRDRIVVRYIDNRGEEEKGIDLGGLFKDFLTDLSMRVFDPSYGLFSVTSLGGGSLLYPNPAASALFGHETTAIYKFVGQVLGKAIFEDITIQPQFAHFFLAFMHGKYSFLHLLDDLQSLDAELYKNIKFLKTYDGDISDLSLTFSVTDQNFGESKEIELFPGGSQVPVTSANRGRYIDEVAKYYLHDRIKHQAQAFFTGLYEVINPDMLSIFSAPELQVIISGVSGGIDIDDLRRNSRYAGGYISMDAHTSRFWSVVNELDDVDKARLLRFVTSCERPPSLGFANLQPPFTIQRVDCNDDSRLPSASTCFNILKLPTYSSKQVMKEKLLVSIRSNAGFDLS